MSVAIKPGQIWRRKSDGVQTEVLSVGFSWDPRGAVMHQAQKRTLTEIRNFLRKYELVQEVAS